VLPVVDILPNLINQLRQGDAILVAPPGAGKSTCLPIELLKADLFNGQKIIMLQPRRIAVRSIAAYLAQQLGEKVGQSVGYRIRGESKISAGTKLEIVTEGILTRMLQSEPELPGTALVIFDEFHERSIHADFSLALCLEVQQALRDELRLLVMSATLDVDALQPLMPQALLLKSEGRSYPVEVHYRPNIAKQPLYKKTSRLVLDVVEKHEQDTLVFLPGASDIRQTASILEGNLPAGFMVHCLFGELSKSEQKAALTPNAKGLRKIILATNIAETSLTIHGIEVVIDSGMEKSAVYQLTKGIQHLQSQRISQASAIQRAGRAGRLGPGTCYRMWSAEQQERLAKQGTPDILLSDMAPFILEMKVWGGNISELALLEQPSEAQLAQGQQQLVDLQAIDAQLNLTVHGRALHALGCHPSVANMLLKSRTISPGHLSMACALAALLESKDPLGYQAGVQASARLQYLQLNRSHNIWPLVKQWQRKLDCTTAPWPLEDTGIVLALAFPQWIGRLRQGGRYLLANGAGVVLAEDDSLARQEWVIVANMLSTDKQQGDTKVSSAEPLSKQQIEQHFSHLIYSADKCEWDSQKQKISAQRQRKLGAIICSSKPLPKPEPQQVSAIWQKLLVEEKVRLPFNDSVWQLIYRLRIAVQLLPKHNWPDMSEGGLIQGIDEWLLPYLQQVYSWQQLSALNFAEILSAGIDWPAQQILKQQLPSKYLAPSGNHVRLEYLESGDVKLSLRMQEMYGLDEHPHVAGGKLALRVELLSPAGRPLQTTQDLTGFWQGSYKDVQKEMKGRYPRHYWPDDPTTAQATTKTKKRMNSSQ
jgi:ATP-dependent helicase HrpB